MKVYCTSVLRKKALLKSCTGANELPKEHTMKKSIAILLILILAGFGLFAAVDNTKTDATIKINSLVTSYSAFGVSTVAVSKDGFKSIANFQKEAKTSIDTGVDMLKLFEDVSVGFLSGINNTSSAVTLYITIEDLVSDSAKVPMTVPPEKTIIAASAKSEFGTLQNTVIKVKETTPGTAALAPAGKYTTTVTISLINA